MGNKVDGSESIEQREHYTFLTRSIIDIFNEGLLSNVVSLDVDEEYGYFTRLGYDDGTFRITYGYDLGLNPGATQDIAKDKGHTKTLLGLIGVDFPRGEEFLLPWWFDTIGSKQLEKGNTDIKTADQAEDYIIRELGYPVYVKPVNGSKGLGVHRVEDNLELNEVLEDYNSQRISVAVVEEAVLMPDYRIVVLDGELISAYERIPLSVRGNGEQTIQELLGDVQQGFISDGRDTIIDTQDPRIIKELNRQNKNFLTIPRKGESVVLAAVSNLSAGGSSVDVTGKIHSRWVELSVYIAKNFNLRLCGVDLACEDITRSSSEYKIIEVNSSPGLDHYARSGKVQERIVRDLYARVLNTYPHH